MAKTETIRARVGAPELKQEAEAVLKALRASTASEAITIFYRQVALRRALPFEVKLPNATTRRCHPPGARGRGPDQSGLIFEELKATHG